MLSFESLREEIENIKEECTFELSEIEDNNKIDTSCILS